MRVLSRRPFVLAFLDLYFVRRQRSQMVYVAATLFVVLGIALFGRAQVRYGYVLLPNGTFGSILGDPWMLIGPPLALFGLPAGGLAWWTLGASLEEPARADARHTLFVAIAFIAAGMVAGLLTAMATGLVWI